MSIKSNGYTMALAAFVLSAGSGMSSTERGTAFIPDTEEDKRRLLDRQKEILKKKGVNEFHIDGHTVLARDYKNALRKVKNLKNKT